MILKDNLIRILNEYPKAIEKPLKGLWRKEVYVKTGLIVPTLIQDLSISAGL
jgi:hypothetical protein